MNKTGYRKIVLLLLAIFGLFPLTNTADGIAEAVGKETVLVPNIIGKTAEETNKSLRSVGLVPNWRPSSDDTVT